MLAVMPATTLSMAHGAAVSPRILRLGASGVSGVRGCPLQSPTVYGLVQTQAGIGCQTFLNGAAMATVDVCFGVIVDTCESLSRTGVHIARGSAGST